MARYLPEFLVSNTEGTVSQFLGRQSPRDCLLEFQEDNIQGNEVEHEAPPSLHEKNSSSRSQASSHSVRRTPKYPRGPESVSSRTLDDPLALTQDPFVTITNSRKHKAHQEAFEPFIERPRGDDPNHITLRAAGMAMAKIVLHPSEAKRWPSAEAHTFMKNF